MVCRQGYATGGPPVFTTGLEPLARVTLYLQQKKKLQAFVWAQRSLPLHGILKNYDNIKT